MRSRLNKVTVESVIAGVVMTLIAFVALKFFSFSVTLPHREVFLKPPKNMHPR